MILFLGARGRVGRHVTVGLLERGIAVGALSRHPDRGRLPAEVDRAVANLREPRSLADHLDGVEAVFLLWPFVSADGAEEQKGCTVQPSGSYARSRTRVPQFRCRLTVRVGSTRGWRDRQRTSNSHSA